ncbi:MAG: nucleotidyltransferase family protein [Pseudomonadales bacterium]
MTITIGCILLAAGQSRRFGGDKRQVRLADGSTLLDASIERYRSSFDELILVLRPGETAAPRTGIIVVESPDAAKGMGHSLAAGAHAAETRGWSGAFVALADMPFVSATTLTTLKHALGQRLHGGRPVIVQPALQGADGRVEPGHPVGFSDDLLPELGTLGGDSGARDVIRRHADCRFTVLVTDPGVVQDVDQPHQLPRES